MRIAIYARVSTDEQKQGGTIDSQIKELERYAQAHSHTIIGRYVDDGWSGSLLSRPALDRLRDDATARPFEAVLFTDVDRLSRDVANLAVVKRDLETKGINLIFQKLPTDGGPLGNFMVNILGSFAELERALIADRTRRGRRFKVQERGIIMGNLPPYGYNYVKKDRLRGAEGRYEINPEEARVVRLIYSWVTEKGLSQRAVTRRLNDLGERPREGTTWARSTVHRILTNETYAGTTYYNKNRPAERLAAYSRNPSYGRGRAARLRPRSEWIPIPLPPHLQIVDRTTFERAQAQFRRNRTLSSQNLKYFYLLREVRKVCGRCGAAYVGTPYHGRPFYRCSKRDGSLPPGSRCRTRIVSARKVEAVVWTAVQAAVLEPRLVIDQVNQLHAKRVAEQASGEREIADLRNSLAALNHEEERMLAAYRTGVTTLEQFSKEMTSINLRRAAASRLLHEAEGHVRSAHPKQVTQDVIFWSTVARERMKNLDDPARQRFLGLLLSEVVIAKDVVKVRGEIPVSHTDHVAALPKGRYRSGHRDNSDEAVPKSGYGRGHRDISGQALSTGVYAQEERDNVPGLASRPTSGSPRGQDFGRGDAYRRTWPFELVLSLPRVECSAAKRAA